MKRLDDVQVPDEYVDSMGSEEAAREDLRKLSVVEAVRRHFVSRGQAADLLGVSLWDIDEILAEHNVPTLELTPEELIEQTQPIP